VRVPFFFGGLDAPLDRLLRGATEQVTAGVEDVPLAGVQDFASGGSLGQGMPLGGEGHGALEGDALPLISRRERHRRHGMASCLSQANPGLIADPFAYFQRHTPRGCPSRFWQEELVATPTADFSFLGGARMITLTVECRDDAERLALEQAIAFARQLHHLAATAPDGQVLAVCERAAG
jgi:hypothetical protein